MNKSLALALCALVLVVGVGAFFIGKDTGVQALGTTITFSNALNQQRLMNDFSSIVADLTLLRTPLASVGSGATAALDFPSLANNTSSAFSQNTSTQVTGLAGALGDYVIVEPVTPTANASFSGEVTTASTTTATFQITEYTTGLSAVDQTSSVFNILVLPKATFTAPSALATATST